MLKSESTGELIFWHEGISCCNERWEDAYRRFETEAEERAKFRKRFDALGVSDLDRNLKVVDLFCGRGNGLSVLLDLGFKNLTGVDLSPELLRSCPDSVERIVADCTNLKFDAESVDVFIVQGGLHHLPQLPDDFDKCLQGMSDALKPGGSVYFVEPWLTPFLRMVHFVTRNSIARALVPKFDAFATMVQEEESTYFAWLGMPKQIQELAAKHFEVRKSQRSFGKWEFHGIKKA